METALFTEQALPCFKFVISLVKTYWGKRLASSTAHRDIVDALTPALQRMEKSLNILRTADMDTAQRVFCQGMQLLQKDPAGSAWRRDLDFAFQRSQDGFSRVETAEEKICCIQIACTCLLILREARSAVISIASQLSQLLREKHIESSLARFAVVLKRITNARENHSKLRRSSRTIVLGNVNSLPNEDLKLLEIVFSTIGGAMVACEELVGLPKAECQQIFSEVLSSCDHLAVVTDRRSYDDWENVPVYYFSTRARDSIKWGCIVATCVFAGPALRARNHSRTLLQASPALLNLRAVLCDNEPSCGKNVDDAAAVGDGAANENDED